MESFAGRGSTLPTQELSALLAQGEGESIEFKRSTGEMREAMKTLCGFLNGRGGTVLFGIRPDGTPEGQTVSDKTLREIVQATERFEPSTDVAIRRAKAAPGREIIAVSVEAGLAQRPFTYEGRPYERVGSTTRSMSQAKYESALVDRAHGSRRWETEPAPGVELRDIDRNEVFRIVDIARSLGRLVGPVGARLGDVLDRLRLRRAGRILQAAVVLFGKEFAFDFPQCELRMARFKGVDKTEFMDQRNVRAPAFRLLEEAQLFCQRHFPLPARIVPEQLRRVETPLIPPDAMREILVNALIHRDYSITGGAISLAIFDDRVEVWSAGTFPAGITPGMLTRKHLSVLRNPTIAEMFQRAGLIEQWGRGTNRVVEMCRSAGISPPTFEEVGSFAVVTFRVDVRGVRRASVRAHDEAHDEAHDGVQDRAHDGVQDVGHDEARAAMTDVELRILRACSGSSKSSAELLETIGYATRTRNYRDALNRMLATGYLEQTIPEKPRSRNQRYRLTAKGLRRMQ